MSGGRQRDMARIRLSFDPANPPAGRKLVLGVVATKLGVTISDLADAAQTSRTSIARILSNEWPVRADVSAMQQRLHELLASRGATPHELQTLFHAVVQRRKSNESRGPDERFAPPPPPAARTAAPQAGPAIDPAPEEPDMLLPKQALLPQTRRHFQIFQNPFDGEVTSDEQMFVGPDIAYCREAMHQCVQTAGFVALIGESGAGKTTLLQDLEYRLETADRNVTVIKPEVVGMEGNDTKGKAIKSADIVHAIITRLKPEAPIPQTLQARTTLARKLLTESARAGNEHLLVVDEAHCMPDTTLKHLKRLHEIRLGRKPMLGILLLAQPELKTRLADGLRDGSLREVAQRCEIVELLPLDGELEAYLRRRAAAGNVPMDRLIDKEAVEALRERLSFKRGNRAISMCYPLAVNNMVTRALNAAAALGVPQVTRDVILDL